MTKEGIVRLCENLYDQKMTENVVLCREKFTKKTNRIYTNYTGCLVEKNNIIPSLR